MEAITIESLQQELAAEKEKNQALTQELEVANNVITDLSQEIESLSVKAETTSAGEPGFEHEGTIYHFHFHKAVIKGKALTSEDILADAELQQHLVKTGSGMIYSK